MNIVHDLKYICNYLDIPFSEGEYKLALYFKLERARAVFTIPSYWGADFLDVWMSNKGRTSLIENPINLISVLNHI